MSTEVQEIFATLTSIDQLLKNIETNVDKVDVKAKRLYSGSELREVEYLFYRVTGLMNRMGLPPEIDAALGKLQHLILMVRMLHTTLNFLQSGTFFGAAMTALTLFGALFTMGDLYQSYKGSSA